MLHKNDQIGDYRLEKFLGKGQFGEVWLAEKQIQFSRKKIRHALKFLINRGGGEIDIKHAQDEIDTWIEAGGHPNVISVLDMLVYDGHVVIVSEYADGGSLKDWMRGNGGKAPTFEKAVELMNGILRGIEHLHSRNVVHRDLKPENILLQGDFPRITDFGISRIVLENTTTTQAIGSPAYMSPEAFMGSKQASTDIWSAGVIFHELLSGTLPFEAGNIFQLKEAIEKNEPRPLPAELSAGLREVVLRALEKDRARRFQSASEMRLALETASYNLRKNTGDGDNAAMVFDRTIPYDEPLPSPQQQQQQTADADPSLSPTVAIENQPDKTQAAQTQPTPTLSVPPAAAAGLNNNSVAAAPIENTQPTDAQNTGGQIEREVIKAKPPREPANDEILIEPEAEIQKIALAVEQQSRSLKASGGNSSAKLWVAGIAAVALIAVVAFLAFRPSDSPAANSNSAATNTNIANSPPAPPAGMVYIPGGEFMMGRDDGKSETEKPAHKVSVEPFFMDTTEVTGERYAEFMKAENYRAPFVWKNKTLPKGQEKFPVVGVDWEDAAAFCKYAGKRLPTEAEWEFAARGTNNFIYPWGNDWKSGNANAAGANQNFTEVGKYAGKSPFGLVDMVGNAWEWTASDFKEYPGGKLPEVFAGKENLKTIRGGSFEATRDYATATYRIGYAATGAESFYQQTGFRCVQDIK